MPGSRANDFFSPELLPIHIDKGKHDYIWSTLCCGLPQARDDTGGTKALSDCKPIRFALGPEISRAIQDPRLGAFHN